jgi:predicted exporter
MKNRYLWTTCLLTGFFLLLASRLTINLDVLSFLPNDAKGIKPLKEINQRLAGEQRLTLLIDSQKAGDLTDYLDLERLTQVIQEDEKLKVVSLTNRDENDLKQLIDLNCYLWLNSDPDLFQKQYQRGSGQSLEVNLLAAKSQLASELDAMRLQQITYDPLGWSDHPYLKQLIADFVNSMPSQKDFQVIQIQLDQSIVGYKAIQQAIDQMQGRLDQFKQQAVQEDIENGGNGKVPQAWKFWITGGPAFGAEIGTSMEKDMSGTTGICLMLIAGLFYWIQRTWRQLIMIVVCELIILIWCLGIYSFFFKELGVISAGFAAILLGLTVDYAMILLREKEMVGNDLGKAVAHCSRGILWGAVTTAAPFAVFMFSHLPGGRQFGFLVAIGVLTGAFVFLYLFPKMLGNSNMNLAKNSLQLRFIQLPTWLGYTLIGAIILTWLGGYFLGVKSPQLSFDTSMLKPIESKAANALEKLQEAFPEWAEATVYCVIDSNIDHQNLTELEVNLKQLQAEGAIQKFQLPKALILKPELIQKNLNFIKEQNKMDDLLFQTSVKNSGFKSNALILHRGIVEKMDELTKLSDPLQWFKKSIAQFEMLKTQVLPIDQITHVIGIIKLKQLISPELYQRIRKLDVDGKIQFCSWLMVKHDVSPLIKNDINRLFLPMGLCLLVSMAFALKGWASLWRSLLCLSSALILLYLTIAQHLEVWHFLHIISLIVVIGAGIDYILHINYALDRERGDVGKVLSSTGMAILFCALTTAIGFGSMLTASNQALIDMGKITAVGIVLVMLTTIFLLPSISKKKD